MRRLTTEEFVKKARAVHGDRYCYDRTVYVRNSDKLTITCRSHGDFEQIANDHLQGRGCVECGGRLKLTTERFVEKARAVHGDFYKYDLTIYVRNKNKITIICPEHGAFDQTPSGHLAGKGCSKCADTSPTTEGFIEKARTVHGDSYEYGRTIYVSAHKKVTITCPIHGDFQQTPSNHLTSKGCAKCSLGHNKLTTEVFLEKAREVHGDTYNYGCTVYVRSTDKITITCPEHGDFLQTPNTHLTGAGCAKCSGKHQHTTEEFIEKARVVHGLRYSYDNVRYASNKEKITITCSEHGDFKQRPNDHLSGVGCSSCAQHGFNPDKQAYLYILRDIETHNRVKIGVSNVPDSRLRSLRNNTPFTIGRIDLFETPPEITLLIEKFCHSQLESCNLQGFNGATEWFKFDGGKLEALREFIKSCGGVPC